MNKLFYKNKKMYGVYLIDLGTFDAYCVQQFDISVASLNLECIIFASKYSKAKSLKQKFFQTEIKRLIRIYLQYLIKEINMLEIGMHRVMQL